MARIRTIKPEFWTDEKVVQLPFQARLLFIGMWNFADDDGHLMNEPDRIRMQILPNDIIDTEAYIDLLNAAGLIDIVDLPEAKSAISIPNFDKHQKISHKSASRIPVHSGKKRNIPLQVRRDVALKYGCTPGGTKEVGCYFCGVVGSIWWAPLSNGQPSSWVCFSGLEIDHFIPEHSGGETTENNIVLSCRYCNRSRGNGDAIKFFCRPFVHPPENSRAFSPEGKGIEGNGKKEAIQGKTLSVVRGGNGE